MSGHVTELLLSRIKKEVKLSILSSDREKAFNDGPIACAKNANHITNPHAEDKESPSHFYELSIIILFSDEFDEAQSSVTCLWRETLSLYSTC